ncbi:aldo-keto reductase family 1 member B1 isoform X2 [Diabrotica virgifera virgifera]|uniref:Aldose reductase-like isoform X2 n=1 Tax=Diabrotica virgifera virgifera TaxID=50390 RepID=A0A6P7GVV8_DIAVI|nr:aldo-keto reductase family 1 member B1 isoform X2 [Diabrotica virgifera virgifera]
MSKIPRVLKLSNGLSIPTIGLGTYKSGPNEVQEAVKYAVGLGYRHIDTASFYGNENEIGTALKSIFKEGKLKREDIFVVTKLWNNYHEKKLVVPQLKQSLKLLELDYIDLYLVHWPFGFKESEPLPTGPSGYSDVDYLETWEGMEECVNLGLAKSIGISNFNEEQMERLLKHCKIPPVVNQVEVNPNNSQPDLIKFCKGKGIVITGFCPLERIGLTKTPNYPGATVEDPRVIEIAKKHNKTPAQVVLRYLLELGISIIPKSVSPTRIKDNFAILDFDLSADELEIFKSRNKNVRTSALLDYKDHKYYPF